MSSRHLEGNPQCALLTGELVAASRLSVGAREELGSIVDAGFGSLNQVFEEAFSPPLEWIDDQRWQMFTTDRRIALRAALYFHAETRARMGSSAVETRIAIGVGTVTSLPGGRVSEGDGAAYRRAEAALSYMARTRRLELRLEDQPLGPGFEEMLGLVDQLAARWTDRQALAVTGALQGWTQERIARGWDRLGERAISQQTVAQHLHRAGWHALSPALDFLEGLLA